MIFYIIGLILNLINIRLISQIYKRDYSNRYVLHKVKFPRISWILFIILWFVPTFNLIMGIFILLTIIIFVPANKNFVFKFKKIEKFLFKPFIIILYLCMCL